MWHSNTHRAGVKFCSSKAYYLESIGESFFMLGVAIFIAALFICIIVGIFYSWKAMWFLLIPVGMIIISMIMRGYAQTILDKKDFKYDYESDTVWIRDEKIILPCEEND